MSIDKWGFIILYCIVLYFIKIYYKNTRLKNEEITFLKISCFREFDNLKLIASQKMFNNSKLMPVCSQSADLYYLPSSVHPSLTKK